MSHETMTLRQAAKHIHLDENELRHIAQRGEVDASVRGGEWFFDHAALDEWAQRHLLASNAKSIAKRHRDMVERWRSEHSSAFAVAPLFAQESVELDIPAKAKAGMVRDMTDLADRSGLVYDPEALFRELMAREDAASTAIGAGVAFLHPRRHDPYLFAESFLAYGRSSRPIFFGAPDGAATRHFFLICAADHELHLRILARLAVLAHGTSLTERLDAAEDSAAVVDAVGLCEAEFAK
jgi:mannitol/fructose-specific phosphotransferase system IIA component (Ntr-type)